MASREPDAIMFLVLAVIPALAICRCWIGVTAPANTPARSPEIHLASITRRTTGFLMTKYYPVLKRAVDALENGTAATRRTLYERARTALVEQLRNMKQPLPQAEITRERLALEEAVRKIEMEAVQRLQERLDALAVGASQKNSMT
jgi:hypothetical protein